MASASDTRPRLRRHLRRAREALSNSEQHEHAACVGTFLREAGIADHASAVAAYVAFDGELSLQSIIDYRFARDLIVALPVIVDRGMSFARFSGAATLRLNRMGIFEPEDKQSLHLQSSDFVLVPLVGYTKTGQRLGQGGGYYDRFFATVPRALLIGIAHSVQELECLDTTADDVPLDAVVTEKGWHVCSNRAGETLCL